MTFLEQLFTLMMKAFAKPPYKLDPSNGKFIEPFMELYSVLGRVGEDMDIGIITSMVYSYYILM